MAKTLTRRKRIHYRVRRKIRGTANRPRLSVFRSNRCIYSQLINDLDGTTIVAASSLENAIGDEGSKSEQSKKVGQLLAERAKAAGIENVIFDRSGYRYHGRVKALADGAREGGLKF